MFFSHPGADRRLVTQPPNCLIEAAILIQASAKCIHPGLEFFLLFWAVVANLAAWIKRRGESQGKLPGGTSLRHCEGRAEARVGDACSSCRTGGWREVPADEETAGWREDPADEETANH
jgi:hypothetical protein